MEYAQVKGDDLILLPTLPAKIRLSDGSERTGLDRMTEAERNAIGVYGYELSPPGYDPETQWRVGPKVVFDGKKVTATYEVIDKTAEEIALEVDGEKSAKMEEIAAARYEAEIAGVSYNDGLVRTDRQTQSMITGAALKAMRDDTYSCKWKTAEGFVSLDAQAILAVADVIRDHVQSCFDREAELAERVRTATTAAEVRAISW